MCVYHTFNPEGKLNVQKNMMTSNNNNNSNSKNDSLLNA